MDFAPKNCQLVEWLNIPTSYSVTQRKSKDLHDFQRLKWNFNQGVSLFNSTNFNIKFQNSVNNFIVKLKTRYHENIIPIICK